MICWQWEEPNEGCFNLSLAGRVLMGCDFGSAILRLQLVRRLVRHLAQAGFGAVLAD